jgi:uncharacterized repeat protein (TIGR02543 family)
VAGSGNLASANKTFAGWNTAADGTGTNYNAGDTLAVTANMTLYAQWLDPSVQRYTVTYHANGASGTPPSARTVSEWSFVTLPGAGGLVYGGKTFAGWNTAANGSGTAYAEGASFTVTGNTTFYAQWASEPVEAQGATLADKFAYIASRFDNGAVYTIAVDADTSLAPTTVMTGGQNVTINLRSASAGDIKTIFLSGATGSLLTASNSITLKLENIILQGSDANNVSLLRIASGGTLVMNTGSEITGNKLSKSRGGAISVENGGKVTILDGKITNNEVNHSSSGGGGIIIRSGGTVTMHGGIISGNKVPYGYYSGSGLGGGILVEKGGCFIKTALIPGEASGIIYGSDVGAELANKAYNNLGDAVYYDGSSGKKRNTTLNGFAEISTENLNVGWE